jgi:hypothetical protein
MSEHNTHRTLKQSVATDSTITVADVMNHRVQKWSKDAKVGVTVAGSSDGNQGSDALALNKPYGLRVDEDIETVYAVDLLNNQI